MRRHCVADGSTKPESDRKPNLIADGSSYGLPSGDTHKRDRRRLHPMRSRPPSFRQQHPRHNK